MRDPLYKEFEDFYSVTINSAPTVVNDKMQRAIADAIDPKNKELHKFTYTEFYRELVKRNKE